MSHDHTQAGAPPVRASDAERDKVGEILRAGYADGRLSRTELDDRLAAAYAAKTRADLRALTSDLPGATSAPTTLERPAPAALPDRDPEPAWVPAGACCCACWPRSPRPASPTASTGS